MAVRKEGNITTADTFEELLEHQAQQEDRAYEWISTEQWDIADGSKHYFMRPTPFQDQMLMIYGWTWDWYGDKEQWEQLPHDSEDYQERKYEHKHYTASLKRGYVFTRSFSLVEPEGELGTHHLSGLIPITEKHFEEARSSGWIPGENDITVMNAFIARYQEEIKEDK